MHAAVTVLLSFENRVRGVPSFALSATARHACALLRCRVFVIVTCIDYRIYGVTNWSHTPAGSRLAHRAGT